MNVKACKLDRSQVEKLENGKFKGTSSCVHYAPSLIFVCRVAADGRTWGHCHRYPRAIKGCLVRTLTYVLINAETSVRLTQTQFLNRCRALEGFLQGDLREKFDGSFSTGSSVPSVLKCCTGATCIPGHDDLGFEARVS